MAMIDALLEVSRHWDAIQQGMSEQQQRQSSRILRAHSSGEQLAFSFLESISHALDADSQVFAALEFSPNRSVTAAEASPPVLLPPANQAVAPSHRHHHFESEVDLVLQALNYRRNAGHSPRRFDARRRTLAQLTRSASADDYAGLIPATPLEHSDRDGSRVEAEVFVWFDIVAAFSILPPEHQNRSVTLAAQSGAATLLPSFQFQTTNESVTSPHAIGETNQLLQADQDPWGAGSWWSTPNGRLGAVPSQLIGTERETELPFAAATLQSDSW